jgi:hypothetical protein
MTYPYGDESKNLNYLEELNLISSHKVDIHKLDKH